jgi:WD40 repeat protein
VRSLAFAPDGGVLASGGAFGTIDTWNRINGRHTRFEGGHAASVNCVAISPDGEMLASAGEDGTIRLWNLADNRSRGILEGHTTDVTSVGPEENDKH